MKISKIEHIHYDSAVPVYDIIDVFPYHNFAIKCKDSILISHNCAIMDESNFSKAGIKDVNKAKSHMKELYDTIVARVEGTFRLNGEVWGKIFSVSSKKSDSDFMEDYVESQLKAHNKHMVVFDKAQWEVFPETMFSKEKFWIAVGNRYQRGFVVENDSKESISELRNQGYRLLNIPIDYKTNFLADFDISLRDLAGIAVPGALSFITQDVINECLTDKRKNPFYNDILEIGTKDVFTIEEFFHAEFVPNNLKKIPIYIHIDLSLNDDKTGISASGISSRVDRILDNGSKVSMPYFSHIFSVAIQAPKGDKIPYAKITNFMIWLRKAGFNIEVISRDQFQSEYMAQLLESQGFKTEYRSLDRTSDGYNALRSILLEKRVDMLDVKYLQDELIYLQRDSLTGKIDHMVGRSKDMSDSFAGSIWNAMLHDDGRNYKPSDVLNSMKVANSGNYRNARTRKDLEKIFPGFFKN